MTNPREIVSCDAAPAAVGPYSQARWAGDLLFISGKLGLVPATGEFAGPDVASQARQALTNLGAVLNAAGLGWDHVVKATVFLTDMADFATFNQIYAEFFAGCEGFPARSCIAVAGLPKGGLVEIEAIAHR